jgi:hypothetical protein
MAESRDLETKRDYERIRHRKVPHMFGEENILIKCPETKW